MPSPAVPSPRGIQTVSGSPLSTWSTNSTPCSRSGPCSRSRRASRRTARASGSRASAATAGSCRAPADVRPAAAPRPARAARRQSGRPTPVGRLKGLVPGEEEGGEGLVEERAGLEPRVPSATPRAKRSKRGPNRGSANPPVEPGRERSSWTPLDRTSSRSARHRRPCPVVSKQSRSARGEYVLTKPAIRWRPAGAHGPPTPSTQLPRRLPPGAALAGPPGLYPVDKLRKPPIWVAPRASR